MCLEEYIIIHHFSWEKQQQQQQFDTWKLTCKLKSNTLCLSAQTCNRWGKIILCTHFSTFIVKKTIACFLLFMVIVVILYVALGYTIYMVHYETQQSDILDVWIVLTSYVAGLNSCNKVMRQHCYDTDQMK